MEVSVADHRSAPETEAPDRHPVHVDARMRIDIDAVSGEGTALIEVDVAAYTVSLSQADARLLLERVYEKLGMAARFDEEQASRPTPVVE